MGRDQADVLTFARAFGVPHVCINSEELKESDFYKNPKDKCYICKKLALEKGIPLKFIMEEVKSKILGKNGEKVGILHMTSKVLYNFLGKAPANGK